MFQMVEGNYVSNLNGIHEGYTKKYRDGRYYLMVNVSGEHIDTVFRKLCAKVEEQAFFILEHGTNQKEEEKLRKSDQDPFHLDVYYLGGLDYQKFLSIYEVYHELLVHDGEICFGYAAQRGGDEIYVGSYKIFNIMTDSPEKYEQILQDEGIPLYENLKTVWNNFSQDSPGERVCVKKNDIGIYDMIEQLKEQGLFLADRRSDS